MILWLVILISLAAGWLGLKKGLYFMFATLFNLMFAVYIAVLSTPLMLSMSPGFETNGYYAGGSVIVLFVLIFVVLEVFGWFFFLRDSEDYFPKMLEKVGGAAVGLICGYAVACTLLFAVCIMPCSRGQMDWLTTRENLQNITRPGVVNVCNFLGWYSLECFDGNTEKAVEHLLTLNDPKEEYIMPAIVPLDLPPRPIRTQEPPMPRTGDPALLD